MGTPQPAKSQNFIYTLTDRQLLTLITDLARRLTILLLTRPLTTLLSSQARHRPPLMHWELRLTR